MATPGGGCEASSQLERRLQPAAWRRFPALPALGRCWICFVTRPAAGLCGKARHLCGKERGTLASSSSPLSPPLPRLGRWPEAPVGPARPSVTLSRACLPARRPAGPGPVSGAFPLPVIPGPALGACRPCPALQGPALGPVALGVGCAWWGPTCDPGSVGSQSQGHARSQP